MFSALSGDVPLVGRSELLATIEKVLREDHYYGALVYGEIGTGKSAVAHHLLTQLQADLVPLLITPASALGGIPYGALAPFLLEATAEDMASPLSVLRQVMSFLRRCANGRFVVVVIDDAHLLDDGSSHLLAQLVTSRTIGMVAFSRPTTPVSDELVSLCRDGLFERLEVGPLTHDEAFELCTLVLDAGMVRGASDRLCDEASGNPLFLKAILDEALLGGSLIRADGVWTLTTDELTVPVALVDLVRAVTFEFEDLERKAFEVLALGEEVAFADLVRVSSEEAVSRLLRDGIIRNLPEDPAFATNAHAVYGRVARNLIPVGRSCLMRRELLAGEGPAALPPRARIRSALWSLDCGEPVAEAQLLTLAREALALLDPRSALRLAGAVRSSHLAPNARLYRAAALLDLGRLEESCELAEGLLERADTTELVGTAAVLEIRQLVAAGTDIRGTDTIVERWARASKDLPGDGEQRRLVAQAFGWNLAGRYSESLASLQPVVEPGSADTRVLAMAHGLIAEALGALGQCETGREHSTTALAVIESAPEAMLDVHRLVFFRHLSLLVHCGDFGAVEDALRHYPPAEGRDYSFISGSLAVLEAATEVRRGRFRSGLDRLRPALAYLRRSDDDALLPYALGVTAWAAAAVGDSGLAGRCSEELGQTHQRGNRQFALLARAFDAAAQILLGADDDGARLLDLAADAQAMHWSSCAKDILELATALGLERAAEPLADVTGTLEGTEADILHDYASALITHDAAALTAAGDRAEIFQKYLLATDACRRAIEVYAASGDSRSQRALAPVIRRRRGVIDGGLLAEPGELEGVSPLTSREREIATLALQGLSNREIARSLTVSTRTVEGHLYRIYVKLGISRRDELTAELGPLLRGT